MDKDNTIQKTEEVKKESAVPRSVNQETKPTGPVKKTYNRVKADYIFSKKFGLCSCY